MDLAAIRADLGDALSVVDALNVITTKPGSIIAPAAILGTYNVTPHQAQGSTVNWSIHIAVSDIANGSFEDLDGFLSDEGDASLIRALEDFSSVNWASLSCLQTSDVGVITVGATDYVGCVLPVEIYC